MGEGHSFKATAGVEVEAMFERGGVVNESEFESVLEWLERCCFFKIIVCELDRFWKKLAVLSYARDGR